MPGDSDKKQDKKKEEIKAKGGAKISKKEIDQIKKDYEADKKDAEKHKEAAQIVRKSSVEKKNSSKNATDLKSTKDEKREKSKSPVKSTKNSDDEGNDDEGNDDKEEKDLESNKNVENEIKVKEVGPSMMERVKTSVSLKYMNAKEAIYSRIPARPSLSISRPSMPSGAQIKESITSRLPSIPSIPVPSVREYLPDMPSLPKVPLPEPVDNVVQSISQVDEENISPLIQRINYLTLTLSLSCMLLSDIKQLLVFKPVNIFNPNKQAVAETVAVEANSTSANSTLSSSMNFGVPYIWTFSTTVFIETNFLFLIIHFMLINYIVIKNKTALEHIWRRKDFFFMICISGFMATCTHFAWRLALYGIFKNEKSYSEFEYCSINFIVLALILGLS
jgi:hypothetical protein